MSDGIHRGRIGEGIASGIPSGNESGIQEGQGDRAANLRFFEEQVAPLAITQIPLFRDVEAGLLEAALRHCERVQFSAGSTLLRPGQANDHIYIILSGTVVVYLGSEEERSHGITIPIGQCIGEFSAIDGKPVSALVMVETEAWVLVLGQEVFWSCLVTLPGVARNMMVALTERTRLANRVALEAQRERLELAQLRKELTLARELQASMLPLQRPLFPDRKEIEVCALMEPASSVGGDFFDAFFVSDDSLFVCIGDVSGHGIMASLLMARTIGLLRILAFTERSPHELLTRLNASMVEGNETSVFATIFCGFLDVASGQFVYSNGGHCNPLRSGMAGTEVLALPRGVLVGAFPGVTYSSLTMELNPGDLLLIYTDGLTEAESGSGEQFSLSGCLEVLRREWQSPLSQLLDQLRQEVRSFSGRDTLDDDFTLLALRRPAAPRAAPPAPGRRGTGGPAR
jgi:sigma-B regulation protein RsbU (phosphoserine phosphatase)